MLDALQARIEELSSARSFPPPWTGRKSKKSGPLRRRSRKAWTEAKNTQAAGDLIDAVNQGKEP